MRKYKVTNCTLSNHPFHYNSSVTCSPEETIVIAVVVFVILIRRLPLVDDGLAAGVSRLWSSVKKNEVRPTAVCVVWVVPTGNTGPGCILRCWSDNPRLLLLHGSFARCRGSWPRCHGRRRLRIWRHGDIVVAVVIISSAVA
jgi:hypothetical protein